MQITAILISFMLEEDLRQSQNEIKIMAEGHRLQMKQVNSQHKSRCDEMSKEVRKIKSQYDLAKTELREIQQSQTGRSDTASLEEELAKTKAQLAEVEKERDEFKDRLSEQRMSYTIHSAA